MKNLRDAFNSYKVETVRAKDLVIDIDGIECYGLWGLVKKISLQDKIIYKGIGKSIFVDKNHDLSYYFTGSDYVDEVDSVLVINTSNKYGYEWGGYQVETGITSTAVGTGLSNTNSLIAKNLRPDADDWHVIWDKIKEFRESHSDQWFLPSYDELGLIYEARSNLSNLSTLRAATSPYPFYWSSSEYSSLSAWIQYFNTGGSRSSRGKASHFARSRLCRQYYNIKILIYFFALR